MPMSLQQPDLESHLLQQTLGVRLATTYDTFRAIRSLGSGGAISKRIPELRKSLFLAMAGPSSLIKFIINRDRGANFSSDIK